VDGDAALRQIELIDRPPNTVLLDVGPHLALETARTLARPRYGNPPDRDQTRRGPGASLVVGRFTNKEVAAQLQIEPGTVKSHVHSVIRTLGVSRRAQVAPNPRRDGLMSEWPEWLTQIEGSAEAAKPDGAADDPELRSAGHHAAERIEHRLRQAPR